MNYFSKHLSKTIIIIFALLITGCGGSTESATNTTSKFFFDINMLENLPGFEVAQTLASYSPDTKEFTVIGYDTDGNKVGEITFMDTNIGVAITKKVNYRLSNNVTSAVATEGFNANVSLTESISTWNPPLIIIPSQINEGTAAISSQDQEQLDWPDSIDSIHSNTCGGPLNLLTEWQSVNHEREITFGGVESLDIAGEIIESQKIKIETNITNLPKSSNCNLVTRKLIENIWVAEGRGVVKYTTILSELIGFNPFTIEPIYTDPISIDGMLGFAPIPPVGIN